MIQAENPTTEMCKQTIQIMHSIYEIASDVVLETRSWSRGASRTIMKVLVLDQQFQYNTMLLMFILSRYFITLLDAVQCIVIGPVCLCVCVFVGGSVTTITRNCVHRSS